MITRLDGAFARWRRVGAYFTPGGKGLVLRGYDWVEELDTASRERCWKVSDNGIRLEIALSSPYE